jgi:hypothetical protein
MGLAISKDPVDWRDGRAAFLNDYYVAASKINLVGPWRLIGTVVASVVQKYMNFAGHGEKGGWLFRLTRKGAKNYPEGGGPGNLVHFSMVPFTGTEPKIVAGPLEHLKNNTT